MFSRISAAIRKEVSCLIGRHEFCTKEYRIEQNRHLIFCGESKRHIKTIHPEDSPVKIEIKAADYE